MKYKFFKIQLFLFISILTFLDTYSQDTICYQGIISIGHNRNGLLSSIVLYQDSLFIWTNEHDLSYSEYGIYKQNQDTLTLYFYLNDFDRIDKDTLDWGIIRKEKIPNHIMRFFIIYNKMYSIKDNGKLLKWTRRRTLFRDRWRWLTLGYRKFYYKKISTN